MDQLEKRLEMLDQRLDNIDSVVTALVERVMKQPVSIDVTCPKCGTKGKIVFRKSEKNSFIYDSARSTLTHTGTALFGPAATTIAGFGLLIFALMPPLQQFGGITALTIFFSFISSVFILPTFLAIWARRTVDKHYEKKQVKK